MSIIIFKEAARLISLGINVIPLCSHDHSNMSQNHLSRCNKNGKMPLIKNWQNHDNTTIEQLDSWIRSFKSFNIGLPLGEASGYCGIDIDGDQGEVLLSEMSDGDLPDTWEFSTAAGRRLLYTIPAGMKTKKFKKNTEEEHQECALLCTGQQTVLPPSIHHTGTQYTWEPDRSPWEIDCAAAPKWLLDLIRVDETVSKSDSRNIILPKELKTFDIAGEFVQNPFDVEMPNEVVTETSSVKPQKASSRITVTEEMLNSVIPAGNRDNTMTAIVGHYCANRDLRRLGYEFVLKVCTEHNEKWCDPPLEEESIVSKVKYFWDAEAAKDQIYKEKKDKRKDFFPTVMAKHVSTYLKQKGIMLHFDQNSKLYYYTDPQSGPWQCTRNTTLINKWIREVLITQPQGDPSWDKSSFIEETRRVVEEIFTIAYKEFDDFDLGAHSDKLSKYIVLKNGMLDWMSGTLIPWDPKYLTTVAFDLEFDPTAKCPRFEQYVSEWIPSEEMRLILQEYLGYCLIPNTKFRKALFLHGKGMNGKSVLLEFIQGFFGDHKATLSYDGLFQRFGPANLKGKLVNIYDDTQVSFVKDTGIIKNLIAGGTISAEFKGRDHFTFTNVARFIFSAQETPKTSDHTDAWYDRWFYIKFPNKFRPSNQKKLEIQTAMKEELQGIFNWMVEGLSRLMINDRFSTKEEAAASAMSYRISNDTIALFISAVCTPIENKVLSANQLYRVYTEWSTYEGLRAVSKRTFFERTEDLGYEKIKGYANGKSGQIMFKGLFLDVDCENYKENALSYSLAMQGM